MLLADKLIGRTVPIRFVLFVLVGLFGLLIHLGILWTILTLCGAGFATAQAVATITAMTSNFFLNNFFTYRDQRLIGRGLFYGLLSFYLSCAIGAVANVAVASYIFAAYPVWWLAGISGAALSSIWNYALSSTFTWNSSPSQAMK
jgi:dolichol-phosphate mannosyltransferase